MNVENLISNNLNLLTKNNINETKIKHKFKSNVEKEISHIHFEMTQCKLNE